MAMIDTGVPRKPARRNTRANDPMVYRIPTCPSTDSISLAES